MFDISFFWVDIWCRIWVFVLVSFRFVIYGRNFSVAFILLVPKIFSKKFRVLDKCGAQVKTSFFLFRNLSQFFRVFFFVVESSQLIYSDIFFCDEH